MKHRMHSGFTLIEIMIVVAIIGLLAAVAIPNFLKARTKAQTNSCISNLRLIDSSKTQWALELKKVDSDTVTTSDLTPYIRGSVWPTCPGGGTYGITVVSDNPTCTISGHTM